MYRTTSHSKYSLKAHIVFIPKYRKKVLVGQVGIYIRDQIRQICSKLDIIIESGKVSEDHVHLFLSYPPKLSISKIVQQIKGTSSYKIMLKNRILQNKHWGRSFWARGYLVVSSGNITDKIIKKYIDQQAGEDIKHGSIETD